MALVGLGTISCALPAASAAAPASADSTCPWGRLGDGRGRLVRCLTAEEAASLQAAKPATAPPTAAERRPAAEPTAPPVADAAPAAAPRAPVEPPAPAPAEARAPRTPPPAEPRAVAPAPVVSPESPERAPQPAGEPVTVEVEQVTADQGALEDAGKGLKKAKDRLAECVEKNGGLSAERGEVEVRALVQARGRAEGVSLKARRGVSEAAARCIVGVVDRRFVGFPEEPAVGVTVLVSVTKKKK